jgi:hypothetical protein
VLPLLLLLPLLVLVLQAAVAPLVVVAGPAWIAIKKCLAYHT